MTDAHSNDLPLLYLDIDGVLLRRRHSGIFDGFELAPHCLEFLGCDSKVYVPMAVSEMSRWMAGRVTAGISISGCLVG